MFSISLNLRIKTFTRQGSFIILEIDPRQTKMIRLISEECGSYVGEVDVRKDCFGVERFVILRCK